MMNKGLEQSVDKGFRDFLTCSIGEINELLNLSIWEKVNATTPKKSVSIIEATSKKRGESKQTHQQ